MSWFTSFFPQPKPLEDQELLSRDNNPGLGASSSVDAVPRREEQHDSDTDLDSDTDGEPSTYKSAENRLLHYPQHPDDLQETIRLNKSRDEMLVDDGRSAGSVGAPSGLFISQPRTESPEYDVDDVSDIDTASLSDSPVYVPVPSSSNSRGGGGPSAIPFPPIKPSRGNSSDIDPFFHPNRPLDAEERPNLNSLAQQFDEAIDETGYLVDGVTRGREVVISYPGSSQYTHGMSVSACGLAALNCVRVILGKERDDGLSGKALLQYMMLPKTIEESVAICQMWESQAHLDVDDIYQMPLFEESLKLHLTHFGRPSAEEFRRLLSDMQELESSAALVITRPPEIIACFKISVPICDVFVTFDSHPRPLHPEGAGFIFSTSLHATAQRLETLLDVDGSLLTDPGLGWQTQLLGNFSGHLFTASDEFQITNLGAAKARLLEMGILALQLKSEISDLKAQMNDLNQTKLHLEAGVETRDHMLGDLRSEIAQVRAERDHYNEMMQRGWSERNSEAESQDAIIMSLQAEVERLQQVECKSCESGRLDAARIASLEEEVSRMKEELQHRDTVPPIPLDQPPTPDPGQSRKTDGPSTLESMDFGESHYHWPSEPMETETTQTLPGGEPPTPKPQDDDDGIRILPVPIADRSPQVDIKGKGKERGNPTAPFWRVPEEVSQPPPKRTDPQRLSSSPDDGWRLSPPTSNSAFAGLRNRGQGSQVPRGSAGSWRTSAAMKAEPMTGHHNGTAQGKLVSSSSNTNSTSSANDSWRARLDAKQDPSPSSSSVSPRAATITTKRGGKRGWSAWPGPSFSVSTDTPEAYTSSNEWSFRVKEPETPLSAGVTSPPKRRELVTPASPTGGRPRPSPARSMPALGPSHISGNQGNRSADLEADRALAARLQYEWNVDDPETAREIERVLREEVLGTADDDWVARRARQRSTRPVVIPEFPVQEEPTPVMSPRRRRVVVVNEPVHNEGQHNVRPKLILLPRSRTMPTESAAETSTSAAAQKPAPPPKRRVYDWMEALTRNQALQDGTIATGARTRAEGPNLTEEANDLERSRALAESIHQPTFDCGVCFETLPKEDVAYMDGCDHAFCRDCMREYVMTNIKDRKFPIYCPTCATNKDAAEQGMVDDALVQLVGIDQPNYEIFVELQLVQFSVIVHCRRCSRSAFVDRKEHQAQKVLSCPLPDCVYRWCRTCDQEVPRNDIADLHSCDGSSEFNVLMREQGWKRCPGCDTPVQKNGGCNHMTCVTPGCNSHFCYTCGRLIAQGGTRHEIDQALQNHYSQVCTLFLYPAE